MKKFLVAIMFGFMAIAAQAEASFDDIQGLIDRKNYAAAEAGLEVIIKNHPNSAKAFYAMAEAQAGLGNLEKAQKALNLAKGIDPTLKFVSESSVRSLEQAITPQTQKITYEEPSHFWRNFAYFVMFALFGWACYFMWCVYNRKKDEDEGTGPFASGSTPTPPTPPTPPSTTRTTSSKPAPGSNYDVPKYEAPKPAYTAPQASAPVPAPSMPSHTTVVNNTSSSNDGLLTGIILGNMMSSHHESPRIVEREVIRETPSRSSSWDDIPARSSSSSSSSRSSSWDDDSSSSKSSSWDDSSSSRSSSWDDSSSSSSSSWDSSSSDSSSSSDW
jgi:hypothetical protein